MQGNPVTFTGITPYLHYDDIAAALQWLARVFGFVEKGRWVDDAGNITNAELNAGACEVWIDGTVDWWKRRGRRPEEWIGIWVDDVDAMRSRILAAGVEAAAPQSKFYGIRVLQVQDPQGYTWGFMERAPFVVRAPASPAP